MLGGTFPRFLLRLSLDWRVLPFPLSVSYCRFLQSQTLEKLYGRYSCRDFKRINVAYFQITMSDSGRDTSRGSVGSSDSPQKDSNAYLCSCMDSLTVLSSSDELLRGDNGVVHAVLRASAALLQSLESHCSTSVRASDISSF